MNNTFLNFLHLLNKFVILDKIIELTGSKRKACAINTKLPHVSWNFI